MTPDAKLDERLRKIALTRQLIAASKRMREAYFRTRRIDSFTKTCPTIEEFDRLLAEYEGAE